MNQASAAKIRCADTTTTSQSAVFETLRRLMEEAEAQWSVGAFGAIAEFARDAHEATLLDIGPDRISAATARGAVGLVNVSGMRLVAYEAVSRDPASWRHAIALCLPDTACAMGRRTTVTELGADREAVRQHDRSARLFDLGLGLLQTDVCIRSSDPGLIAALRASEGRGLFDADNGVLMQILHESPHRVFLSPLGRAEVYQPIPPPNGKSPPGPHTHILPKLLRARRTHAATTPIPTGWVPCATAYPAHAVLDPQGLPRPFDRGRYDAFNELFTRFGDPRLAELQDELASAIARNASPETLVLPAGKFARASLRVGLRKLKAAGNTSQTLQSWIAHYDRPSSEDGEDETQHAC